MHSTLKLGTGLLVYPVRAAILAATLFALVRRHWLLPTSAVVFVVRSPRATGSSIEASSREARSRDA